MFFHQRFVPGLALYSDMVGDEKSKPCAVIDPTRDVVPKDRPVAVVCGSGYRASIASSFLKREGYTDVANVLGGMAAWKAAGWPTVRD